MLTQCSVMPSISMLRFACSFANMARLWSYWLVPRPLRFWKANRSVWGDFSSVNLSPIQLGESIKVLLSLFEGLLCIV